MIRLVNLYNYLLSKYTFIDSMHENWLIFLMHFVYYVLIYDIKSMIYLANLCFYVEIYLYKRQ